MHCVKLLGQRLMARDFDRQVAEFQVRVAVLNGYTALDIPVTKAMGWSVREKGQSGRQPICATELRPRTILIPVLAAKHGRSLTEARTVWGAAPSAGSAALPLRFGRLQTAPTPP